MSLYNPSEIHFELRNSVRSWSKRSLSLRASERDKTCEFDAELFAALKAELGLIGMSVPQSLGGAGLDLTGMLIVFEELSRIDASFCLSFLAHELLFLHQLSTNISNEKQKKYLQSPIASLAMTEPHSGTDVLDMRTKASIVEGGYILNGEKQWISNAPLAETFLVYAKTGENRNDISLFVVERKSKGLFVGVAEEKMGMRSSPTSGMRFDDVFVPAENLVGKLHGALPIMMKNLIFERLGLSAMACGLASAAYDEMSAYVVERRAFGKRILEFGQIQQYLAESYAEISAARALLYDAANRVEDSDSHRLSDAVKLISSNTAERVSRRAIQCMGANGYSSAYEVERYYRDAILLSIGGGTNEVLQKNIAKSILRNR